MYIIFNQHHTQAIEIKQNTHVSKIAWLVSESFLCLCHHMKHIDATLGLLNIHAKEVQWHYAHPRVPAPHFGNHCYKE